MEGWVDLGYPAVHRPGVKPAISRSQVRRPNHYTTEPQYRCSHVLDILAYRETAALETAVRVYQKGPGAWKKSPQEAKAFFPFRI